MPGPPFGQHAAGDQARVPESNLRPGFALSLTGG